MQTSESSIPLKPVLRGVRDVAFFQYSMNRLGQTESAVFQLCRFTVFPKDPSAFITGNVKYENVTIIKYYSGDTENM